MREACAEARRAGGSTYPNPRVGTLIVEDGELVARGVTQPPGQAHAEVVALRAWKAAGRAPSPSTTLYVTLEPCSTHGRTPPCTDAIAASGIRRVVVGAIDPNPKHGGRGLDLMRAAGITVVEGVLAAECTALNPIFNHAMTVGGPLIAAKIATTLDGRIATRTGASKWITGPEARADVHDWRRYFPAIGVGAGTVWADDPALTARLPDETVCPARLIFDRRGTLVARPDAQVFSDAWAEKTVWITGIDKPLAPWTTKGVAHWPLPSGEAFWPALKARLAAAKRGGLYLEGGPGLLSEAFAARAVDYLFAYRAPVLVADAEAPGPASGLQPVTPDVIIRLADVMTADFGPDQLMAGRVVYPA